MIDSTARMAWLLATCRLFSPVTGGMSRAEFVRRMREDGIALDGPRVSRWESGSQAIGHRHLTAYEAAVGQPEGALLAANRMLLRAAGESLPSETLPGTTVDDLDELFQLVERLRATGGHWLRLAGDLGFYERVYLHAATWTTVCNQLVDELTRSSGVAFLRRHEAAVALLTHPQSRRHMTRSVGRFVMHPDAQNVAPALGLLREVADEAASELVLRLMGGKNGLLRRGAVSVAGALAAQGAFGHDSLQALERHAGYELRKGGDLSRRTDAIELAAQLPESGFNRVLAAIKDRETRHRVARTRSTMELVDGTLARIIAEGVAAYAEAATNRAAPEPDQMLRRLVREGLFHVQRERRHIAAVMLGLSPYGRAVAQTVLKLTEEADDQVASMCWSLLRRLGHVVERDEVAEVACAEKRLGLRARGFVTTGLSRGTLNDDAADHLLKEARSSKRPSLQHAALFALGMADHTHLAELCQVEPEQPRRNALWWRKIGPALHDDDVPSR
ncbi:MAG: hypothetical protein M3237_02205 [Actinomycetota bacterium]|nr:hypothetical protein [Actinomycetota bacterium]